LFLKFEIIVIFFYFCIAEDGGVIWEFDK